MCICDQKCACCDEADLAFGTDRSLSGSGRRALHSVVELDGSIAARTICQVQAFEARVCSFWSPVCDPAIGVEHCFQLNECSSVTFPAQMLDSNTHPDRIIVPACLKPQPCPTQTVVPLYDLNRGWVVEGVSPGTRHGSNLRGYKLA